MISRSLAFALTLYVFTLVPVAFCQDQNSELIDLVLSLLSDEDKDIRSLALEQVRTEAKGRAATEKFAAQLPNLSADAQAGLLSALADRGDAAAKPALLDLLKASNDESVSVASIEALGALGGSSDCKELVGRLASSSKSQQNAARKSLIQLRGDGVSDAILAEIKLAATSAKVTLIGILASRRALDTIPHMLQWSVSEDANVRASAMTALGQLGSPDDIPGMVRGVLKAKKGAERAAAEKNLMFVCNRKEDKDERAIPLLKAMRPLPQSDQITMLSTLGRVGGRPALSQVESAIKHRSSAMHSAGITALANWPDASVAPQLIRLAKTDKHANHRITLLRALIRIAPLPDGRTDLEKLRLLQTAMGMSTRDTERTLVLKRAAAIRLPETLRFVLPYANQPKYAQQACETIVELAHHRQLRDDNKAEFHRALDKVLATSKNATVLDRADRYKKGQTWVRPK